MPEYPYLLLEPIPLLISLVQQMKDARGVDYIRSILQYEIDSLGSGGTFEIQRGGGHS